MVVVLVRKRKSPAKKCQVFLKEILLDSKAAKAQLQVRRSDITL